MGRRWERDFWESVQSDGEQKKEDYLGKIYISESRLSLSTSLARLMLLSLPGTSHFQRIMT